MQVRKEQHHTGRSHNEGRGKRTEGMSVTDVEEVECSGLGCGF